MGKFSYRKSLIFPSVGSRYYCDYYQSTWPSPPTIAGVNMQQNFAPNVLLSSHSGPQPDPEGTEGFSLPSVTAKVTNLDRSDYKNYLIRDMHSSDVQSLNGVKTLLQEEIGERVPTSFHFDVGFYRGNKQVWMLSDNDVKEFF